MYQYTVMLYAQNIKSLINILSVMKHNIKHKNIHIFFPWLEFFRIYFFFSIEHGRNNHFNSSKNSSSWASYLFLHRYDAYCIVFLSSFEFGEAIISIHQKKIQLSLNLIRFSYDAFHIVFSWSLNHTQRWWRLWLESLGETPGSGWRGMETSSIG